MDGVDATPLLIETDRNAGVTLRLVGDLDMGTSGDLQAAVGEVLQSDPGAHIAFDLSGVGFMDSSGLAVLIGATNAGATVCVVAASPAVRLVITATGLDHLLSSP